MEDACVLISSSRDYIRFSSFRCTFSWWHTKTYDLNFIFDNHDVLMHDLFLFFSLHIETIEHKAAVGSFHCTLYLHLPRNCCAFTISVQHQLWVMLSSMRKYLINKKATSHLHTRNTNSRKHNKYSHIKLTAKVFSTQLRALLKNYRSH